MANKIVGTKGDDVLKGTKKKDIIKGKGGNDVLIGKKGNDVLKGGKGNDDLQGGKGNDDLKGGSGKDLLFGGKDADDLRGGKGADIFKFKFGDGFHDGFPTVPSMAPFDDIVYDYQDGIDKFDIPDVVEFGDVTHDEPSAGPGAAILYGDPDGTKGSFFVRGVTTTEIDGTDFI